ncbi:MAG: hypothetical protein NTW74_21200 [Acidobacteria bacterium]|nr:hypothetical protein [Acidobacteriota bacterium]
MKHSSTVLFLLASTLAANPTLEEILEKMHAADQARQSRFTGYTGTRNYTVTTPRVGLKASMQVEVNVLPTGVKQFKILSISGPGPLRKLVFQRMLDTEAAASQPGAQLVNKINPDNYSFKLLETRPENGRPIHVLSAEPKSGNPLLFRGQIWVDAQHHAILRMDGAPAKKPSMWVESTHFIHDNKAVGEQWVPHTNRSETQVRIFGKTTVVIEYNDYKLTPVATQSIPAPPPQQPPRAATSAPNQ